MMLVCASLGFSPAYRPTARPLQPSARSAVAADGRVHAWPAQHEPQHEHRLKVPLRSSGLTMGADLSAAAARQLPRTVPLTGDTLQALTLGGLGLGLGAPKP